MASNDVEIKLAVKDEISRQYKKILGATRTQNKKTGKSFKTMADKSKKASASIKKNFTAMKVGAIALVGVIGVKLARAFIKAGSEVEDLTTSFRVLLGSTAAATARMKELEKFAQTTPFQLTEIAEASKILQTLTKGALASGDGLRLVGDVAAATGADFKNLALHVGRAFDGLKNNRPVGESMMRLQELGIVSGGVRAEIEALTKKGMGVEAWNLLEKQLAKTEGGMEAMSKTASGMTSTLKDQLQAAMRKILSSGLWTAFVGILKQMVDRFNNLLDSGIMERLGGVLFNVGKMLAEMGRDAIEFFGAFGVTMPMVMKAGALALQGFLGIVNLLRTGFLVMVEGILKGAKAVLSAVNQILVRTGKKPLGGMATLNTQIETMGQLAENSAERARAAFSGDIFKPVVKDVEKINEGLQFVPTAVPGGLSAETATDTTAADERAKKAEELRSTIDELALMSLSAQDKEIAELQIFEAEKMAIIGKNVEGQIFLAEVMDNKKSELAAADLAREKEKAATTKKMRQGAANDFVSNLQTIAGANSRFGKVFKAAAIAKATADTFSGANAAFTSLAGIPIVGPVLGAAAAAAAIGAGIANVAKIKGQKFAHGGVVEGQRTGDRVPILANGGERILTARQNQALESGGSRTISFEAPIINIQNGDPAVVSAAVNDTYQEIIAKFAETERDTAVHELSSF